MPYMGHGVDTADKKQLVSCFKELVRMRGNYELVYCTCVEAIRLWACVGAMRLWACVEAMSLWACVDDTSSCTCAEASVIQ